MRTTLIAPGYDHITSGIGAQEPRLAHPTGSSTLAVAASFQLRDKAISKARFEPIEERWAVTVGSSDRSQFRWEDQFNLSLDTATARESVRSGNSRRQYHDEPRRLAGARTDCAKRSPLGKPAVRRWVH